MVRVSREVTEPSGFFVCVAESEESIQESLEAVERLPNLRYHCTPKGAPPETAGQNPQIEEVAGGGMTRDGKGREELKTYLLTIIVITSIMTPESQEVGHDQYPQERGTRPRRPRLAEHAFHLFVRRLLRSQAYALSYAARDERRPRRGRRRLSDAPAPRYGNRHVRSGRRAGASRQHGQRLGDQARRRAVHERGNRRGAQRIQCLQDRAGAPVPDLDVPGKARAETGVRPEKLQRSGQARQAAARGFAGWAGRLRENPPGQ